MRLAKVFVRFYKSFNYDYLRKFHTGSVESPWERVDGLWYPFVRVPIDPMVTTIVGANESGKSHLLTAIEKGLTGEQISRADFCRYSRFFSVEQGKLKWPDFGFQFDNLADDESSVVAELLGADRPEHLESFYLFRTDQTTLAIYSSDAESEVPTTLNKKQATALIKILPIVTKIDARVALPNSIPIKYLTAQDPEQGWRAYSRSKRGRLLDLTYTERNRLSDQAKLQQSVAQIAQAFSGALSDDADTEKLEQDEKEMRLARDLLLDVARIDPEAFKELYSALTNGQEGHAAATISHMNELLKDSLNFPSWWVQDKDFSLQVSAREFDLVFTIKDRTKQEYEFKERSQGLRYFLSYYIQYLRHQPATTNSEILLMDEPDAYLSSQGQQDLLKIFEAFADPRDDRQPLQVVYVTHSPFLIDKNHPERIRVLEKGIGDEGTRVVKDTARNHYEPLRSAFGAFVGETTFIGNSNLMVEGQADQILLVGATTALRERKEGHLGTLNLNNITIVPAGSASHIPYLVFLARGRDVEKPPVVVLLDSDAQGNAAKKQLSRRPYSKALSSDFIIQLGDLEPDIPCSSPKLEELEDLIPPELAFAASVRFAREICGASDKDLGSLDLDVLKNNLQTTQLYDAVKAWLEEKIGDCRLDKVPFARYVVEATRMSTPSEHTPELEVTISQYLERMRTLFSHINTKARAAEREQSRERVGQKVARIKKTFLQDFPTRATKEHAVLLFEELETSLGNDLESDLVRTDMLGIRREFAVDQDQTDDIVNYESFKARIEALAYAGRLATQD